jgi:hypothetical protein
MNGVVVHTGTDGAYQSYLLDMTPATNSWDDPALAVGQSFTDEAAGLTITTVSADSTGALVQISLTQQSCINANPTVTMTPGQTPWQVAGGSYVFNVSVINNDIGGCQTGNFNLGASLPSGWTASFANPVLSLAPGGSSNTTLAVGSPAGTANGTYGLGVTASNQSNQLYSGNASSSYVVVSNLVVNTSPGSASYSRTQKATITATVSAIGSPTVGASVMFTLTKANGSVVTKNAVTDSTGKAVFTYTFDKRRDPLGTYNVTASAIGNGVAGIGNTSFIVNK